MTHLSTLKTRLESASGPDRELDRVIHQRVRGFYPDDLPNTIPDIGSPTAQFPTYTASVDAALDLVERRKPGATYSVDATVPEAGIDVDLWDRAGPRIFAKGIAPTLPLAILIALLEGIIAEEQT